LYIFVQFYFLRIFFIPSYFHFSAECHYKATVGKSVFVVLCRQEAQDDIFSLETGRHSAVLKYFFTLDLGG